MTFRFSKYWGAGKLSMILTTFRSSCWNLLSKSYVDSSKSSPFIQLFACACYRHGKCLIPEKHLSSLDLSITNICSFSPQVFGAAVPLSCTLLWFPPVHFSPSRWSVLPGTVLYNKPNLSALKLSCKSSLLNNVGKVVWNHTETILLVTALNSHTTSLNVTLFLKLKSIDKVWGQVVFWV